ncbi:zinc finger protein 292 isoform X1 [Pantherophis guttatus]|uniref:Zinc finger protein 292 n=2 Tax=Pantherophis guttatus TaxID=94885 RepID=A0A6P9BA05_PANGU|nr:zinc finger protein 292 isoform X1 [Pantherophis guttatus]XP_034264829.1 zinc finger protein 292 isoform X1 [Pantherophis guttatus]XP_034264830.1 zinc finger protein 292 isoform X1 [Pantherophis guttatus]
MADEEAEQDSGSVGSESGLLDMPSLNKRLLELETELRERGSQPAVEAATEYCQQLCQTLLEYAEKWKTSEDPLPLLEVYTQAIHGYIKARPYLTSECENVAFVLERLALSYAELLLCLPLELPENRWKEFQSFIQMAHTKLMQNGSHQLHILSVLAQEDGTWKNPVLRNILSQELLDWDKVNKFLAFEGPVLLDMRIKHLVKTKQLSQATALAKLCSDHPEISSKGNFKQTYLVCLCSGSPNEKLMQEITDIDCKDALEMICNLESEGDEKSALILCAAFLSRQLQQGEMYCAWELTLFWSKLQQRVEPSTQIYLERCRQLSVLTKTVYHIFFLIKVINSEIDAAGLATCIELCVKALRLEASENTEVKISICKTISCLLPDDLEVKRACQLSEFLLEPTVDAYYAVEMLYNQPDQKYDEENLPIPNSLRCELLLVLKTQWPFDPEFWDWKMLKRQCLALMGEEASIVSSIDELNDSEMHEKVEDCQDENKDTSANGLSGCFDEATNLLRGIRDKKQKNREIKKLRERGFISARFRNWQAYMQYCVLCDKEFLGHRIVRHAQKHYKDGIYSCPICAQNFNSKETFVPHVTLHVKKSSKERLAAMKPLRKLGRPPKTATTGINRKNNTLVKQEQRHIKKNSLYAADFIVFNDNDGSDDENYDKDKPYIPEVIPVQKPLPVNEFTCPVTLCKKGFKYFKNLIAHVKGHKDNEEAKRFLEMQSKKVICQYCRRHFVSVTHLNDHLQMHCGIKPYICIQIKCKASFNSYAELLSHRKEHPVFRARCMFPKCGRVFSEAYLLYDHEAQHYNTFTCKLAGCGKVYHSQNELEKHIEDHTKSEKILQSDGDGNCSQSLENNENTEDVHPEETLVLPPDSNVNNCAKVENYVTDEIHDESLESESTKQSTNVLEQPNSISIHSGERRLTTATRTESLGPASNVLIPLLGQKIRENMAKKGKLPTVNTAIDVGASVIHPFCSTVEDTCSNLSVFHEVKEDGCIGEPQTVSMNSDKLEPDALATKSQEKESSDMSFSTQNQLDCQNLLSPKPQLEESVRPAVNLYNQPLKNLGEVPLASSTQNIVGTAFLPVVPLAAPVQRFTCQVEGCTRIYNSSQSIGKHMKTAHPDQYAEFKIQWKNKKSKKISLQNLPNDNKPVYFLPSQVSTPANDAFPQQTKTTLNPTCTSQLQQLSNVLFPTRLENTTNSLPIVENVGLSSHIKNENALSSQLSSMSSATLPSQMDDLEKPVMPLNIDSGSDPFLPLPAENGLISLFPSPAHNSPSSVFSQMDNTSHFSSQLEGNTNSFSKEESVDILFPSQINNESNFGETTSQPLISEKTKKDRRRGTDGKDKKPKHNKRAKWPAIIRDGKFICSRCYRVFSNPRSLGGHLSKRSYCKPLDESEISPEVLQLNGQSSLLASMILSSNALSLQQQQESTYNPDACFKEPSFLQLLANENRPTAILQNLFPRTNMTSFNPNENEEGNEIIKQALETAGIPSTFDSADTLPHIITTNCVTNTTQINTTVLPNPGISPSLPTSCNSSTLLTDQNRTLNTKISSEECNSLPVFSDDLILKTIENGLCPHLVPNSAAAMHNLGNNLPRVSVISSIKNSEVCSLTKKENSGSKKKKKTPVPLVVPHISQNLAVNDLAGLGLITRNLGQNMQATAENFQSNIIANSEAQGLVENLTKKLSNVNNGLTADIKENVRSGEVNHVEIVPLALKNENGDSQVTPECCIPEKSNFEISNDNIVQNFEKTLEIIKTAMNSQKIEVKSEIQEISIEAIQSPQNNIAQCVFENPAQLPKPNSTQCITRTQNIVLAEASHKDDIQLMEILEGLKKLNLESETSNQVLDNITHCLPANTLMPQVLIPSVTPETTSLVQTASETHPMFVEKVHKPFTCQAPGCNYSAMTKDALFKHYSKIHQYTAEMILEIKKHQLKYAPFKCVVANCPKTFTRNSNLRAHCQLVHHFTTEEMVKLKLKRPYGRRSQSKTLNVLPRPNEVRKMPYVLIESKRESHLTKELDLKEEPVMESMKFPERLIPEAAIPENTSDKSEKLEKPSQIVPVSLEIHNISILNNNQVQPKLRKIRRHRKEEEKKNKKPIPKPLELPTSYNPYRPYKCVHQGCFAAFTIQQNLILHYQAVHKSDLPLFSLEAEEESEPSKEEEACKEEESDAIDTVKEFRCEVRNCSRIFQEVTSLFQHYMKLHEMTPEEIGTMKSSLDVGRFLCDQSECKSSFTTYVNYITHLETDHDIKIKQSKTEDCMYKCDCEGCDRIYATRSNLLRHIFNKHNDRHKDHLIRPRRFLTPGQENISIKANQEKVMKIKYKGLKHRTGKNGNRISFRAKRRKAINVEDRNFQLGQIDENQTYSLKCGKYIYSVKAKDDALSECSNQCIVQYPCMIKGCSSVVTSENNVIRHYKCHKLSKAFTLQHRDLLIVSNRHARPSGKEVFSQNEATEDKVCDVKEVQPPLPDTCEDLRLSPLVMPKEPEKTEKDEVDELAELFITKLINEDLASSENHVKGSSGVNNDCQETSSSLSEKQSISSNFKRVNKEKNTSQSKKRKVEKQEEILAVELSSVHREQESAVAIQTVEEQSSTFDWSSFKPMGFEVSFLKFLEESAVKQKKNTERGGYNNCGTRKRSHSNSKKSNEKNSVVRTRSCSESETRVQFANPSQFQCSGTVKIVLDKTFKDCTERVLKQLQEMKPIVSLIRLDGHWEAKLEVTK